MCNLSVSARCSSSSTRKALKACQQCVCVCEYVCVHWMFISLHTLCLPPSPFFFPLPPLLTTTIILSVLVSFPACLSFMYSFFYFVSCSCALVIRPLSLLRGVWLPGLLFSCGSLLLTRCWCVTLMRQRIAGFL